MKPKLSVLYSVIKLHRSICGYQEFKYILGYIAVRGKPGLPLFQPSPPERIKIQLKRKQKVEVEAVLKFIPEN